MLTKIPDEWQIRPLREIVEFLDHLRVPVKETDREKRRGPFPYYGANGLIDRIDGYIFDEPLVLLAEDGGFFGSKDHPIAYKIEGKAWVNNHAHVLRPIAGVIDIDYLHWFLSFRDVTSFLSGSTRAKLTKSDASRIPVILPNDLGLQKRIAGIMNRANSLRQIRDQANQLTGKIIQSVFLKMFGDPSTNPRHWNAARLGDFTTFVTSGSRWWKRYYSESGAKFIRVQNLTHHRLDLSDIAYVNPPNDAESQRTRVRPNDLLISITGEVGLSAVVPSDIGDAYVSQHVALVRLTNSINPFYVASFLMMPTGGQAQLARMQYGQTRPGLNLTQVKSVEMMIPPKDLQDKFASVVERVGELREAQSQSTHETRELFDSLMHKAFAGEIHELFKGCPQECS